MSKYQKRLLLLFLCFSIFSIIYCESQISKEKLNAKNLKETLNTSKNKGRKLQDSDEAKLNIYLDFTNFNAACGEINGKEMLIEAMNKAKNI